MTACARLMNLSPPARSAGVCCLGGVLVAACVSVADEYDVELRCDVFARDRDLWVLEPNVFTEVRFTSQRTLEDAEVIVSDDGIQLGLLDGVFSERRVKVGSVLELNGIGLIEVTELVTDQLGVVSRLRSDREGSAIRVTDEVWSGTASGWTFLPQIGTVHRVVLMSLGLEVSGSGWPRGVGQDSVLNTGELAHVEALGTLEMLYSAVAPTSSPGSVIQQKAERYGRAFKRALDASRAVLDLDGDGNADAIRLVGLNNFRRA